MVVCRKNLHHAQKLQKRVHNKRVKPQNYALSEKVWFNSKYIKIKRNCKLKTKFFEPFRVFYPIEKQAYKLELLRNWRIYDIFHMSLLEYNITRKRREFSLSEFEPGNDKEYEIEVIQNSVV